MRIRLLCCAVLFSSLACIHRVAPGATPIASAPAGTEVKLGEPQLLPEGTSVHWQFGDGTPEQVGAQVTHVFPHAGDFTVVETVQDKDGEKRSLELHAMITRRGVAQAIPADARSALILERPWARFEVQRKAAERVGLGELFHQTDRDFSDLFGFAASDPKAAEENGADVDEGIGLYTVPQDLEALVACAGVSNPEKAVQSLQHLLARDHGGAFALHPAALPDGTAVTLGERNNGAEKIGFLLHGGYLYLRVPGASDPLLALASAAALPLEAGLEKDAKFNAALGHVGPGDAVFYSAGREGDAVASRFANQISASAFSLTVSAEQVQIRAFGQPKNLAGQALVEAFTPASVPPDFAARLPVGAAFYAKASGAPATLWNELLKALGPDGQALRDRLALAFGSDIEKLLPDFTGNGAIALYLDAQSLIEALLGEQVATLDRSTFITVSELKPGTREALRSALNHAAAETKNVERDVRGASFWRISDGIQVAIKGDLMFAAIGGAPEIDGGDGSTGNEKGGEKATAQIVKPAKPAAVAAPASKAGARHAGKKPSPPRELTAAEVGPLAAILLAPDNAPALALQLKDAPLPFTAKSEQMVWIDIRGTLARLQSAADEQGGMVGMGVRRITDRVGGLRDALLDAHPTPEGIVGTITLRFMPESMSRPQ